MTIVDRGRGTESPCSVRVVSAVPSSRSTPARPARLDQGEPVSDEEAVGSRQPRYGREV